MNICSMHHAGRRSAALAAAGVLTLSPLLLAAGTANADAATTTLAPLKASQLAGALADYAGAAECRGYTGALNLWHFVVPALDASPASPDADITAVTFNGTSHLPDGVSGDSVQNGKGFNVYSADSTVTSATATLSAPITVDDAVLVLSHTCAGTGAPGGGGDLPGGGDPGLGNAGAGVVTTTAVVPTVPVAEPATTTTTAAAAPVVVPVVDPVVDPATVPVVDPVTAPISAPEAPIDTMGTAVLSAPQGGVAPTTTQAAPPAKPQAVTPPAAAAGAAVPASLAFTGPPIGLERLGLLGLFLLAGGLAAITLGRHPSPLAERGRHRA